MFALVSDRPCGFASCMGGLDSGGVCVGSYADSEAVCVREFVG